MAVQAFERVAVAPSPTRVDDSPVRGARPAEDGPARRSHLRVVRADERMVRPPLRLTRRGRLVRTLLVFGALSLLGLVAAARWATPDLPPTHSITVQQGQTLSQIAAQELPMVPTRAAAVRIRIANGLSSSVVISGQNLVIPGVD